MAFVESLAQRIRDSLARKKNVEEKKMFGGIGFLLNGNVLVDDLMESLIVLLGSEQSDEPLREANLSWFSITGQGTMKGWLVVSLGGVETDDQLSGWIRRAVRFAAGFGGR
jgi:TfoX/Sxy family transcriptional regulator of competence genes